MAIVNGAELIGRVLKEEGVKQVFGVHGGNINAVLTQMCSHGIKMYHMRHEQAAGYAADGWARSSRSPGVCFSTAAPGFANMFPGIHNAHLCMSPIVALVGGHETTHDKLNPMQEVYAADECRHIAKWTQRVTERRMYGYYLRKALRDCMLYPPGPVVLELPINVSWQRGEDSQLHWIPKERLSSLPDTQGDPREVEKAVKMLMEAKRPLLIGGDGIYWSHAEAEFRELAELIQVPVHLRRMGRGAMEDAHPLAFTGGNRQKMLDGCDLMLLIGMRASFLDDWFQPPMWTHEPKIIQVQETADEVFIGMPTDLAVLGTPKLVIRQMIECVKSMGKKPPVREEWLQLVRESKEKINKRIREAAESVRDDKPIHLDYACQAIADTIDKDATVIYDSFMASVYLTDKVEATFAGQILDSALHQGVGHSVGMAIGAQLARPGKQVVAVIGDGGCGVGGMDIETARRYNLPIVFVLINNDSWVGNYMREMFYSEVDNWDMIHGIRYDRMFKEVGCHTEHVEDPTEIRPALERCFKSGTTSVLNIAVEEKYVPGLTRRFALIDAWSAGKRDRLPEEARQMLKDIGPRAVKRAWKFQEDLGVGAPLEEIAETAGYKLEDL
ncbi:thiamine pyrophosphate-binding protein [Chloroflexota bacterium]